MRLAGLLRLPLWGAKPDVMETGGALGFYTLGLAADKRYSLNLDQDEMVKLLKFSDGTLFALGMLISGYWQRLRGKPGLFDPYIDKAEVRKLAALSRKKMMCRFVYLCYFGSRFNRTPKVDAFGASWFRR